MLINFVPSLVEIAQWFWRRLFLIFAVISLLSLYGKEHGISFEQTLIPFSQGCFVPSLVEIGGVVLDKYFK